MAVSGWVLDKSAAARAKEQQVGAQLRELAGSLYLCQIGELEQLYSARSAKHYDELKSRIHSSFEVLAPPDNLLERALTLQSDLAHRHGMWHRTPISDLLIAETALFHGLGVVHVDADYERIAEVRELVVRRLG